MAVVGNLVSAEGPLAQDPAPIQFGEPSPPEIQIIDRTFVCKGANVKISYIELHQLIQGRIPHQQVQLIDFLLSDMTIDRDAISTLRKAFASYAWIDKLNIRCPPFRSGVAVEISGMPYQAWYNTLTDRISGNRPEEVSTYISLKADGTVKVETASRASSTVPE